MDDERINSIVASEYLKLYLEYSSVGVGNKTEKGRVVTQKAIDIFQDRLKHYINKIKEK